MDADIKIAKIIAIAIVLVILIYSIADTVGTYYKEQTKIEAIRAEYIQHEGD